jgi:uncharacterized protein with FMN-binding domain
MTSKKYKLLLGALMFLSMGSFAQVGGSGSVYDSSVIPAKRMPQQNEFWNNSYNFPAKPRNQLEVGFSVGMPTISGDVSAKVPTIGGAVHVRKALGYLFSLRLQYLYGIAKGLNWKASYNYAKNTAWDSYNAYMRSPGTPDVTKLRYARAQEAVFYNYKTKLQDIGLQGIFTFNNIRFHKNKTGLVVYAGVGAGVTLYHAMVNALNGSTNYNFNSIVANSGIYDNRKDTRKALKDMMDDSYETEGQPWSSSGPKMGKNFLKPSGTFLGGLAFKLSKRINLALEDRITIVKTDGLDGQMWNESPLGDATLTGNFDSYNYVSLGLNFNLGSKAVEPLWWQNPLDYAYDELMNHRHVKIPKMECPDADGDGVCDHLDREPNTPAGCPVDTHGVTKDTDGDGVPDCKDKELITPTSCQPVDADGVGKCPDPECCKNRPMDSVKNCPSDYPSISFKNGSAVLSADAKSMCATVASKLKGNPTCNITVTGYPETDKRSQANCQKRVEAIKNYLVEKEGISADRITTNCEVSGGDKNTVDIKSN